MVYDDISGLLKTTAVVARTGLSTVNTTWVYGSWVAFVLLFGAVFVAIASGGYALFNFFNRWCSTSFLSLDNLGAWYDLVGYTCNFSFLWGCVCVYYWIILTFISLYLAYRLTQFINTQGPLLVQFFKNTIDWIFGEGL